MLAAKKQANLLALNPHDYQRYKCSSDDAFSPHCYRPGSWEDEALAAILCSDTAVMENLTKTEFDDLARSIRHQSWVMGDYWPEILMPCVGWNFHASWRYDGTVAGFISCGRVLISITRNFNITHSLAYTICWK